MGFEDYTHNIEKLRKYLASDLTEFVRYHLMYEDGFRIGPPQIEVAKFLATPDREKLIIGFRGLSKTYLAKYYAGWRHLRVPTSKIKFISDNLSNAQKMAKAYLQFLRVSPVMEIYRPSSARMSRTRFDLNGIRPEKDPSVDCIGIDGSIVSSRSDIVISDDIENLDNSTSPPLSEALLWKCSEFQAVLHPAGRFLRGPDGYVLEAEQRSKIVSNLPEACQIVYINTYQHTQSIFLPTEQPDHPLAKAKRLVIPALKRDDDNPQALPIPIEGVEGKYVSTWPERFSTQELIERCKVPAKFMLDYMCDVKTLEKEQRVIKMERLQVSDELKPRFLYCYLDPAQGGACETAAAFGGPLGDSRLYVSEICAWQSDPTAWIPALIRKCKSMGVVELHVETKPESLYKFVQAELARQGGGFFIRPLVPKGDKASRITGNLEWPLNSGTVVFASRVLADGTTKAQLEGLKHGPLDKHAVVDRLDALAHLVGGFAQYLGTGGARLTSGRIG